jgi:hypothetical protein
MFIPPGTRILDPDFSPYRIQQQNKRGENFYGATNFTKPLKIILFLSRYRKKFDPIGKELLYFLPKKLSLRSQKNMGWGSGIRKKTYSGSRD